MTPAIKELGRVCIVPTGKWIRTSQYERLDLVYDDFNNRSYIAKEDVPAGVNIDNNKYWQLVGNGNVSDAFIVLHDKDEKTGRLKVYNFDTAREAVVEEDRRPGAILGFYTEEVVDDKVQPKWMYYQFNSANVKDWNNVDCWDNTNNTITNFIDAYYKTNIQPTINNIKNDITILTRNFNTHVTHFDVLANTVSKHIEEYDQYVFNMGNTIVNISKQIQDTNRGLSTLLQRVNALTPPEGYEYVLIKV